MRNCHVRHLTLQASTAAAARHGAQLVEDGLRTASLPGESSQLLIVRTLAIGAIRPSANPITVAQQIERALAQLPLQAVAATAPAAASAPAVYFADEVEACVQLAIHAARGHAPTAWFWPRAVAGWRNGASAHDAVRCALFAAAQLTSGPAAVVRVVAGLLQQALLDRALADLTPADGPDLLQRCGWRQPVPEPATFSPAGAAQPAGHPAAHDAQLAAHDARLATWMARGAPPMRARCGWRTCCVRWRNLHRQTPQRSRSTARPGFSGSCAIRRATSPPSARPQAQTDGHS